MEANLQVYYSADTGTTWQQVSTTLNLTRNTTDNYITITDAAAQGDYVLSSAPDPISVRPSIMTTVIGRSQIRIGAPNRFTIHYVNNSDAPTDDFLLCVNTGSRVHMNRSEHFLPNGTKEILPKDSLSFEGEDTSFVYYVTGMDPREERKFEIIATAYPALGKTLFEPFTITVGAVLWWGAKAAAVYVTVKTIDYLGDKAREGLVLTPEQKRNWESTVGKIPEEIRQKDTKKEWAMKKVGGTIIEKTMGLVGGTVDVARAVGRNVYNIVPNLRRQIWYWLYKETGLYGVEEKIDDASYKPEVSNASAKTGQPVVSWDPNEKIGPAGIGPQGFISSAGKMNYQILFENKKEATASAYKVVIVDTLRPEFDASTVEFGKTSHDGPNYLWKVTNTNNILRWEIEGIELPPNATPPEGEGYVTFSVMTKSGLLSGTSLKNSATITFDMNKPITTNTFTNTIDFLPPTTVMGALASTHTRENLTVKWQSTDGTTGAGVQSVTVFGSKDNGPYQAVGTSLTDSLVIRVTNGIYKFYALATDNVGNSEMVRPALVQTTVSGVVGVAGTTDVPLTYQLEQNFPNPFNPTTTIEFSLAQKTRATLKIYDMLGRELANLVDEIKTAGKYSVTWDAGRFSSGMYFYRLTSGDFVQTRKLVILK
ncbi:MAG: T9SS type A sorting domain-containing protein [bacterium]